MTENLLYCPRSCVPWSLTSEELTGFLAMADSISSFSCCQSLLSSVLSPGLDDDLLPTLLLELPSSLCLRVALGRLQSLSMRELWRQSAKAQVLYIHQNDKLWRQMKSCKALKAMPIIIFSVTWCVQLHPLTQRSWHCWTWDPLDSWKLFHLDTHWTPS